MTTTAKTTTAKAITTTATAHDKAIQYEYDIQRTRTKNLQRLDIIKHEYAKTNEPLDTLQLAAIETINEHYPYVIRFAIWYCFGLGSRPNEAIYDAVDSFRQSSTAQVWHDFCYQDEHEYYPIAVPRDYALRTERAKATKAATHAEVITYAEAIDGNIGLSEAA